MQSGGVVENKKSSNRPITKRNGGAINKPTPKSMGSEGHTHQMDIDIIFILNNQLKIIATIYTNLILIIFII